MGIISNFFKESDFDEYRELQNILEADEEDEDDFDMPEDEENQEETVQENPEDNMVDDTGDDDFDMPEDDNQDTGNQPEPQVQEEPTQEIDPQANGDNDMQDNEDGNDFDMPDGQVEDTVENPAQGNGGEEQPTGGNGDLGNEDQGGEDDFDLPDDGEGGEGADDTADTDDTNTNVDTGPDPDQDLKDAEAGIFNNLSDNDKIIKINELKGLYEDLYNRIVTLYDKVNELPKQDDLIKVYNFVIDNLGDLKQFVYDYTSNTFDNKTYLENLINYKKYLSTLNIVNGILEEIRKGLYNANK